MKNNFHIQQKGFTILELLVAVSVTALLAGMLLNITSQVVKTQTEASGDLETNQIAQFVLDRIQEDLQCAIFRNDGNVWMVAEVVESVDEIEGWDDTDSTIKKPEIESIRIHFEDWSEEEISAVEEANLQGPFNESRFGVGGTWLRFFSNAPELDPDAENSGGARAISYQIIRHGLTSSETSTPKYQLFRADVSDINTLKAGYNLEADSYKIPSTNSPRESGNIANPLFTRTDGNPSTDFSLAANIVDFGIRAYLLRERSKGTGYLEQIFPDLNSSSEILPLTVTSNPSLHQDPQKRRFHAFPDVIDVMIRVLTTEGASALAAYEDGLIPPSNEMNEGEFWWDLVEKNSEVYIRRIKIFSEGI